MYVCTCTMSFSKNSFFFCLFIGTSTLPVSVSKFLYGLQQTQLLTSSPASNKQRLLHLASTCSRVPRRPRDIRLGTRLLRILTRGWWALSRYSLYMYNGHFPSHAPLLLQSAGAREVEISAVASRHQHCTCKREIKTCKEAKEQERYKEVCLV